MFVLAKTCRLCQFSVRKCAPVTLFGGIRFAGDDAGDQRRVVTPADAMALGSTYLVIGRSITGAQDPLAALERAHTELQSAASSAT